MLHKAWKLETPWVENLTQNILPFIFCVTFPSHSYGCTSEFKSAVEQLDCSWQEKWEFDKTPWIRDLGQMVSTPETEPKQHPALPVLRAVGFRRKPVVRKWYCHLDVVHWPALGGLRTFQQRSGAYEKNRDPSWCSSGAACTCKRLLGAVPVPFAQRPPFCCHGDGPSRHSMRAVRDKGIRNVSGLKPPESLKWQSGAFNWNKKVEKTQQGDFSLTLVGALLFAVMALAGFGPVMFKRCLMSYATISKDSIPAPTLWAHKRVSEHKSFLLLSVTFPGGVFATTFVVKFLGKPTFPCKGSQLPCMSFTSPWSIGVFFSNY